MILTALAVAVGGAALADTTPGAQAAPSAQVPASASAKAKPNVVFILTDDLSMNLIKYMSAVQEMQRNGTTLKNFFAADGLCCPSRANILTGKFPHNTKVRTNVAETGGGYPSFVKHGNEGRTFAVPLDKAGYRTGFMGKYMNGYKIDEHKVPEGWDEWHASSNGYANIGGSYRVTDVRHKGDEKNIGKSKAYYNDLLGQRAKGFVDRAKQKGQPFFLELSSFAPHSRVRKSDTEPLFPPARRDRPKMDGGQYPYGDCGVNADGSRVDCRDLKVARGNGDLPYEELDTYYRDRVRMVQSLNDQIGALRTKLKENGQLDNTYFVFSSDNGFHLGEHGLKLGKGTAYDHDTQIPLIVQGPGVKRGASRDEIAQTVDLYATFQQMAGLKPEASDGRGLLGLLRGETPADWRDAALYEHGKRGNPIGTSTDPDNEGDTAQNGFVPVAHSYNAIRTGDWLYVEYTDSERRELYDLKSDPGQNKNIYTPDRAKDLEKWLNNRLVECGTEGKPSCWKAGAAR